MRKKHLKKLTALFTGAMLIISGAVTPVLTAFAGEQLGQNNFDDGVGLPWHIVESGPGKMDFDISDGKYKITIVNPGGSSRGGEDRWDCQFRHRGLKIVSGHQYRVQYEITASNSGKYYTKIGNLEGNIEVWHNMSNGYDLDSHWDPIQISANQTKKVDITFTANQTIEVAEWAFHLGGSGQYTNGDCFPAGTVITFDNMSLIDLTSDENDYVAEPEWVRADIVTNQIGYFTDAQKLATLIDSAQKSQDFYLVDAQTGSKVYTGSTTVFGYDADSDDYVSIIDFSDFNKSGTYKLETASGQTSRAFYIGTSAEESYASLVKDALNYFYQNRSGIKIEAQNITSGDASSLARDAGHNPDIATIEQTWGYTGSSGTQDVSGGWYDAGDHGKYVVNGGISLWLMQNEYEIALINGTESVYADNTMSIPENNNGYPDLLDEARYELEWMMKMMVTDGSYKNMVYHKVHDEKWTGLAVAPSEDDQKRIIKPPTTAATLNVSACAAQAARLWKGIDDTFADKCLQVAKDTYEAALAHPAMYAPLDESVGGGAYGDDNVTDEFYWAACELYLTTGDSKYYDDAKASKHFCSLPTSLTGGEDSGVLGCFDWGNVQALGTLSLSLYEKKVKDYSTVKSNITAAADTLLKLESSQGYGLPYGASTVSYNDTSSGYAWGSNSFVVDNSVVLAYAYQLTGTDKYLNGAISGLDYLLGRNAMDNSYVTGYGSHTTTYPHHRWWANLIDSDYPLAPKGVLSGGPNSGLNDPWVQGLGWKAGQIAPQKCYVDHIEAWSVNECTINWNAPLAWVTSFIISEKNCDALEKAMVPGTINAPTNPDPDAKPNTPAQDETKPSSGKDDTPAASQETNETDNSGSNTSDKNNNKTDKNTKNDKDDTTSEDEGLNQNLRFILIIVVIVAILIAFIVTEILVFKLIVLKNKNKN